MATWKVTVSGKGVRQASVEKLAEKMREQFGDGANVRVQDATPPASRADRFAEATGMIGEARSELESLRDELQEWYDNLPENFQNGSKGEELQEAIDALDNLVSEAENLEGSDVTFPAMY